MDVQWQEAVAQWRTTRAMETKTEQQLGISLAQLSVLLLLAEQPERRLSMKEIVAVHASTPAVLTGIADRIERRGFIERIQGTDDRRVTYLALTAEGQAFVDTALGVESPKPTPRRKRAS